MARPSPSPMTLLALTVFALVVSSLTPTRFSAWLDWLRGPVMTMVAPVAWAGSGASLWLRPGDRIVLEADGEQFDSESVEAMRRERDLARALILRLQARTEELESTINALQGGVPFGGAVTVTGLYAKRVGVSLDAGTLEVNRGSLHGVTVNTAATAVNAPHQLVGLVSSTQPLVSSVHLITDERIEPELIEVVIVPPELGERVELEARPRAQLRPSGDGTFESPSVGAAAAEALRIGDVAHLNDPTWPLGAQMLVVGRVTAIEPTDEPLFKRIVVRPELDLQRLRGVVLRLEQEDDPITGETP